MNLPADRFPASYGVRRVVDAVGAAPDGALSVLHDPPSLQK